jgi:hypothetical protein
VTNGSDSASDGLNTNVTDGSTSVNATNVTDGSTSVNATNVSGTLCHDRFNIPVSVLRVLASSLEQTDLELVIGALPERVQTYIELVVTLALAGASSSRTSSFTFTVCTKISVASLQTDVKHRVRTLVAAYAAVFVSCMHKGIWFTREVPAQRATFRIMNHTYARDPVAHSSTHAHTPV